MSNPLDRAVKGAPAPHTHLSDVKKESSPTPPPLDPTSLLPSSPPQIYLNLLILEASLRQQYLSLRARKRQHTLVVIFIAVWTSAFVYLQFLRPREDGSGIGGSVYWLVDVAEKVALIGGCVMGVLFWATGQWERGMRWPRRWLGVTNRGLRVMNCKIVIVTGPWWRELFSHLSFLLPMQPSTPGSNYRYVEYSSSSSEKQHSSSSRPRKPQQHPEWAEEDVAPSGSHVKILLLPKQFTPDFRENWELFRAEYWEAENQRRSQLRRTLKVRDRQIARQQGGWLWWTGWRGWSNFTLLSSSSSARGPPHTRDQQHTPPLLNHVHSLAHSNSISSVGGSGSAKHRRRPSSAVRGGSTGADGSHSRSSSRSSVASFSTSTDPSAGDIRERRWSTASSGSATSEQRRQRRRSKLMDSGGAGDAFPIATSRGGPVVGSRPARLTPSSSSSSSVGVGVGRPGSSQSHSRPGTPNWGEVGKRYSTLSTSSTLSEFEAGGEEKGSGGVVNSVEQQQQPEVRVKMEPAG